MARVLVIIALIGVSGSIGYYLGYNSGHATPPVPVRVSSTVHETSRARTIEPAVAPASARTPESTTALGDRRLSLPLRDLKPSDILDTFDQARGGGERRHEATDIMAPRGTPVYAVDDGVIKKLFLSKPGGITIYQFDPDEHFVYYYAHLDRYADRLHEGQIVHRGDLIGYVGSTGNADPNAPHLHFAILRLSPSREWWHDTTPINPYPYLMAALDQK